MLIVVVVVLVVGVVVGTRGIALLLIGLETVGVQLGVLLELVVVGFVEELVQLQVGVAVLVVIVVVVVLGRIE